MLTHRTSLPCAPPSPTPTHAGGQAHDNGGRNRSGASSCVGVSLLSSQWCSPINVLWPFNDDTGQKSHFQQWEHTIDWMQWAVSWCGHMDGLYAGWWTHSDHRAPRGMCVGLSAPNDKFPFCNITLYFYYTCSTYSSWFTLHKTCIGNFDNLLHVATSTVLFLCADASVKAQRHEATV